MPRIRGASIEEHHERVWSALADALRELLLEQDYESITMGHIATKAGLARNTLYNYAPDKGALVRALTERASRPLVDRVTALDGRPADRLRDIIAAILEASADPSLALMFRPGSAPLVAEVPKGPDNPFTALVAEVENVVRDGVAEGEFRDVDDVPLTVEILSGAVRAGAERLARDPDAYPAVVRAVQNIVLGSLTG